MAPTRPSHPFLLPDNLKNAHPKPPSDTLPTGDPNLYRRRRVPSLPFAGHDRITSIFRLRKVPELELQSLRKPGENFVRTPESSPAQAALEESNKKKKSSKFNISDYAMNTSSRSYLALKDGLVQSLDANDSAIKKAYSATTIARDVLIAANQHPTEKGLNQHLMVLRKNITVVNFSSDLATFRWDVIDPEPAKPSNLKITTSTVPHGSKTSIEEGAISRLSNFSESKSLESTSHQSSSPSTPCPVQKPLPRTSTHPNRVTKPSSSRTTLKTKKTSCPPLRSPYFDGTPQPQVIISASSEHKSPPVKSAAPRTPNHTCWVTKQSSGQTASKVSKQISSSKSSTNPKSQNRGPRRPAIIENKREIKKPIADFRHPFQCRWANCQKILTDRQTLRAHIMIDHIVNSLTCGWDTCDSKLPLAAVPLWHHVLDVHMPEFKLASGKEKI